MSRSGAVPVPLAGRRVDGVARVDNLLAAREPSSRKGSLDRSS